MTISVAHQNFDIENLVPFHNHVRKYFDEEALTSLADTIKIHGVLQPLLIIRCSSSKEDLYEVVSGMRRLRAARIAGLKQLPCIVLETAAEAEKLALIENIQRQDLNPLELGMAFKNLLEQKICSSVTEIAQQLGIQKSKVSEYLGFLEIPESIRERLLATKVVTRELLRTMKRCHFESDMDRLIDRAEKLAELAGSKRNSRRNRLVYFQSGDAYVDWAKLDQLTPEQSKTFQTILETMLAKLSQALENELEGEDDVDWSKYRGGELLDSSVIARSAALSQSTASDGHLPGLLRCARNDGLVVKADVNEPPKYRGGELLAMNNEKNRTKPVRGPG